MFFVLQACSSAQEGPCFLGSIKSGYKQVMTNGKMTCEAGTQSCVKGKWEGPQVHDSCDDFR